jgi:hypothetical protein
MAYLDDFEESVSTEQIPTKKNDNASIAKIDFSKYESNNWLKVKNNKTLNQIQLKNGAIWLNASGELCYRFSDNGTITSNTTTKANTVFTNFLNADVRFLTGTKENQADVKASEFYLIQKDDFRPTVLNEFFQYKELWYRNIFEPTQYLKMSKKEYAEPRAILSLIKHLAKNDEEHYRYILNWLAYFFTGLKKSQVALVLRGNQGAGKGILFENIIKPLFGAKYCIQVNDKTLNTNFLGGIVENKLFFNLDEISHNVAGNKNIKNFLKALVTNKSITAEKKNINMDNETRIYGQVLITSNEPYILEIETSDRRYTVFSTGDSLTKVSYLGYGNYANFAKQIKSELEDFSLYLKSYDVDNSLANTALDTADKRALINATNDKFKLFVNAIEKKDINFFSELEENNKHLYNILIEDFEKNRIQKENLTNYFNNLFDEDIKAKGLIQRLRAVSPILFDDGNLSKSNGHRFYRINST